MTPSMEDAPESEMKLSAERMMELAELASRLIIERCERLPDEPAWRGGTRAELETLMREDPPEHGRPAEQVLERAAREILPVAGRVDHHDAHAHVLEAWEVRQISTLWTRRGAEAQLGREGARRR